jgi:hypothetical protein
MKHSTPILLTLATALSVNSLAANAHEGAHPHHTFEWLAHMMSSGYHLLALAGTALVLAAGSAVYKRLKRSKLEQQKTEAMQSLSDH